MDNQSGTPNVVMDDEIDLKELIAGVWRIRSWIVGSSLLAIAVAVSTLAVQSHEVVPG